MRSSILAAVVAVALHAQAPRGSPEPKPGTAYLLRQPSRQPAWKFFPDLKSLLAAPAVGPPRERISLKLAQPLAQPCAIPLLNVLRRDNVDAKMILTPGPAVDAKIRIVAPPGRRCQGVAVRASLSGRRAAGTSESGRSRRPDGRLKESPAGRPRGRDRW